MNLFSAKKIVLTCSFLFIIMFYFSGGLDDISTIEIPSIVLPEFGVSIDEGLLKDRDNIKPQSSVSQSFDLLLGSVDSRTKGVIQSQKSMIDGSTCDELENMYDTNTGWAIRPYISYKLENECTDMFDPAAGMSAQCQKAYNLGPNQWYKDNCMK